MSAAIDGADAAGITSKMSPEEKNLNVRDALAFLSAVRNTFTDESVRILFLPSTRFQLIQITFHQP